MRREKKLTFGVIFLLSALTLALLPLSAPVSLSGSGAGLAPGLVAPPTMPPGPPTAQFQAFEPGRGGGASPPLRALAGTQPDGEVAVGADGHLKATRGLRDLFDYFLMASDEVSDAELMARAAQHIATLAPEPARQEAQALLVQYMRYREVAARMLEQTQPGDVVASRFESLKALRRRFFTPDTADTFFAEEEAQTDIAQRSREILTDTSLSETERTELLRQLKQSVPPALRLSEHMALAPLRELQAIDEHAQGGVPAAQIRAERLRVFGPEATRRLEALDTESAAWESRLHDYVYKRDTILADKTLSDALRAAKISQLREALFTAAEALRLDAAAPQSNEIK